MSVVMWVGVLFLGCDATVDVRDDDPDGELADRARQKFEVDVLRHLNQSCKSCHSETRLAIHEQYGFYSRDAGSEYETILTYRKDDNGLGGVIDFQSPRDSVLLTKNVHDGPAWTSAQAGDVVDWLLLEAERWGGDTDDRPEIESVALVDGFNRIPLDAVGAPGASITFNKNNIGSTAWFLTNITFEAGANGALINHPLFTVESADGERSPDIWDTYALLEYDLDSGFDALIGGGSLILPVTSATDRLLISFATAAPCDECGDGSDDQLVSGCQAIGSFVDNVTPTLSTNCAAGNCHGGNAAGAIDMIDLDGAVANDDTDRLEAICRDVLFRTNTEDVPASVILFTTDPAQPAVHPQFKFGGDAGAHMAFENQLITWIADEAAAQL